MAYCKIPDGFGFSTEFDTWIIAFCPDTDSWFVTNKRFFYYEYEKEFKTEEEGIEYFENNLLDFFKLNEVLTDYRPSFNKGGIFFETTNKFYKLGEGN